jgi:hypothetical protein
MYLAAGFTVDIPDDIQKQKNPDIVITGPESGEHFYIEVSKVNESKVRDNQQDNYEELYAALSYGEYQLPYSCNQLAYISPDEMPEVLALIHDVLKRATFEKQFIVHVDEKIRIAVAHPDRYSELGHWITINDFRKGLLGLPLNFNDTSRIANYKIEREAEQIPVGYSGLIYLPINALYYVHFDMEESINYFNKKLMVFPNVLGVVTYGYLVDDAEPANFPVDGHFFNIRRIHERVSRYLCFVRNEHYTGTLTEVTLNAIYSSFQ